MHIMKRKSLVFLPVCFCLAVLIILASCKRSDSAPVGLTDAETQEEVVDVNTGAAKKVEVPVITVPEDLPDGIVLNFDVPPIPEHELHSFPLPPVPTDVKDIVQKIKPARKTHEYNEECKQDIWKEYDDQDRLIYERHSPDFERWTQYTENGSRILSFGGGMAGYTYLEKDSKNREIYYLRANQECCNEYTDYDDYYICFTWNQYKIDTGNGEEIRTETGWSRREGDKSYLYAERSEGGIPIKEWEFYQMNDDINFSCRHFIKYDPRLCPPNPYSEKFRVSFSEKKPDSPYTVWEWDNSGYSCKTVSKSKEGYNNTLRYYFTKDHEAKSGYESGSAGDYFFRREWNVPEPIAKYGTEANSISILEKGNELLEFNQQKDNYRNFTGITIFDPETGRSYTVNIEPGDLRYSCQKDGKILKMYSVGYDNDTNTSVLCKRNNFEDEWEQIFPDQENE